MRGYCLIAVCSVAAAAARADDAASMPVPHKNLAYGAHERQKLDLYVPKSNKPLPVIVWIHGGGWELGDKAGANPALLLIPDGFAVASINYRFSRHAVYPAQLQDCQAAIRYLRDHAEEYNLDAEHIGVWGASAGGHLAALLGTTADVAELDGEPKAKTPVRVQAVCDWFGPTDLAKLVPPNNANNVVAKLVGGPLGEKKQLAATANPANYATADDAPTLIFHGTVDPLVPLAQSELLHKALTTAGVASELVVLDGAGHGDGEFRKQMAGNNRTKTRDFFRKHLKP